MYDTTADISAPNPWISIWTEPRATIRYLINTDPGRSVVALAVLGGIAQSLSQAIDQSMGEQLSLPMILPFAAGIGSVFGVLALYVGSYLVQWTGRWIGGEGSLSEIRTALGWANVPMVAYLAFTLLVIAWSGPLLFLSEESLAAQPIGTGGAMVFLIYGFVAIVLGIWSFIILLKGVGEVQGCSAWKAWGNLILAVLPFIALGVIAAILIPLLALTP